ncbi:tellurium resistance protein TehB [Sulfurifustis variabilis]|uniref:Tellurium resistance protein TehB n=1 Tax=Sulfurifustis variabilis TaxID=1675686 RepID=A0A1B4V5Q4_9GAMM|nr:class I SAM-dependent methyltransferase [Sulfurifustis variabilis]BAU48873.1 tellurium resistance protein TehB [Sulfurifustis variabilis]
MRSEIERWNAKYLAANPNPRFEPDPLLVDLAPKLRGGVALDVACGVAHNAMFLAEHGYEVLAVDGSLAALRYARDRLRERPLPVWLVAVDLDRFAPAEAQFDLIVIVRFLDRSLISRLVRGLRPGGLFVCKTFNVNYQRERPAFNPDFLLKPGELARLLRDLQPVATNDAPDIREIETYWIGRRVTA